MSPKSGFTLVELLIAVFLAAFVMIGVMSLATNMVRYQFEGTRQGHVSAYTLLNLQNMINDIRNATDVQTSLGGNNISIYNSSSINNIRGGGVQTTYAVNCPSSDDCTLSRTNSGVTVPVVSHIFYKLPRSLGGTTGRYFTSNKTAGTVIVQYMLGYVNPASPGSNYAVNAPVSTENQMNTEIILNRRLGN